ncbi:MAG: YidH family protein [Methylotenera sp.]|jgi:inner membrane protein YidH
MTTKQSDPRVFFAAERTLLAWLRTGLTIIGLGFIISRFGLFIQLLVLQPQLATPHVNAIISKLLGISFVLVGSILIVIAAIQHKRFVRTLTDDQLPNTYVNKLAYLLAMFIASLGVLLAVYLWVA